MTTEEMIVRILENPDIADVTANAVAAKLRAAEELAEYFSKKALTREAAILLAAYHRAGGSDE